VRWLIALLLILILGSGCVQRRYQSDRTLKMLHIFGIGWLMEREGTNTVRVFGIGSVDATVMHNTIETNAPSLTTPAP